MKNKMFLTFLSWNNVWEKLDLFVEKKECLGGFVLSPFIQNKKFMFPSESAVNV